MMRRITPRHFPTKTDIRARARAAKRAADEVGGGAVSVVYGNATAALQCLMPGDRHRGDALDFVLIAEALVRIYQRRAKEA